MSDAEGKLKSMSMVAKLCVLVEMAVAAAEVAAVASTGVADVGIPLVVPVVVAVAVCVRVVEPIWTPTEVISSINLSIMVPEATDVTGFVVRVSPDPVVTVVRLQV